MSVSPITPRSRAASPDSHIDAGDRSTARAPVRVSKGDEILSGAHDRGLVSALLSRVPSADRTAAQTAIPAILEAARRTGTSDPNRLGYLLATAQTESDFGAHMTETGHSQAWFNSAYGGADGNRPGSSDGYVYRGRGYVQTTRAGRYAEMSSALDLPAVRAAVGGRSAPGHSAGSMYEPQLVAHPEKLAEPRLAARALVVGVVKNLFTHNPAAALDTTIPTGKPPGDVDFYHARGIVNGIVHDQALTIARHATAYARVIAAFEHAGPDVRGVAGNEGFGAK